MPNIDELRSTLFETLQAVKSGQMEIDRAKAVSEVAQVIINTAKVEIEFAKSTGADVRSSFIEAGRHIPPMPQRPTLADQISSAGRKRETA